MCQIWCLYHHLHESSQKFLLSAPLMRDSWNLCDHCLGNNLLHANCKQISRTFYNNHFNTDSKTITTSSHLPVTILSAILAFTSRCIVQVDLIYFTKPFTRTCILDLFILFLESCPQLTIITIPEILTTKCCLPFGAINLYQLLFILVFQLNWTLTLNIISD